MDNIRFLVSLQNNSMPIYVQVIKTFSVELISIAILMMFFLVSIKERIIVSRAELVKKSIITIILLFVDIYACGIFVRPPYQNLLTVVISIIIFVVMYKKAVDLDFYPFIFLVFSCTLIYGFSFLFKRVLDVFLHPKSDIFVTKSMDVHGSGIFFEILMLAVLHFSLKGYLKDFMYEFRDKRVWKMMTLYPAIVTLISFIVVPYYNSYMWIGRSMLIYIISLLVLFIVTVIIYCLYYDIARYVKNSRETEERNIMLKIQTEQYNNLNELIMNNRRMKHDFRHHLIVINELIEEKRYEELKKYVIKYIDSMPTAIREFTSCLPLNAILTHYENNFVENNIICKFKIDFDSDILVEEMDLCVLIGNLLENSLLASLDMPINDRCIEIILTKRTSNIIVVRVSNKFNNIIIKRGEEFVSTRHEEAAFGLKSVKDIVNKYNGRIEIKHDKPNFIVSIVLIK